MLNSLTLCSDEFPFVRNKIALEVHQITLDIHVTDLTKFWVRAHHFCFFLRRGCFPVVHRILPKTPLGKVSANRLPENEKLSGKSSKVINPADSLPPPDFSNRPAIGRSTPGQQIHPAPCCTYIPRFLNDDKPAFSVFSSLYFQSFRTIRTLYRNFLRFLGKPVEVV